MESTMIVFRPPLVQWKGIDTSGDDNAEGYVITKERAKKLLEDGVRWVARYLKFGDEVLDKPVYGGDHGGCYSLSVKELEDILDSGLGLVPVQWGPSSSWHLGVDLGRERGKQAVAQARALGIPDGTHLWCDLEGRAAVKAGSSGCTAYLKAWAEEVSDAGYRAGLYIGDPAVPLTGAQLYSIPGITSYWRCAIKGLEDPYPRGWSIVQSPPTKVAGISCDRDILVPDWKGETPYIVGTVTVEMNMMTEAMAKVVPSQD